MNDFLQMLLYSDAGSGLNNWTLLGFRVLLALELFRAHGLTKLKGPDGQPEQVPNPLGLPARLNSGVAAFADTVVPFLVMAGVATRLVVLPVIGITAIGYLVVHRADPVKLRDVPYMYTICFLLLLLLGAGSLSVDHYLWLRLTKS